MKKKNSLNLDAIELIILDIDATLIDTVSFIETSYFQTFEKNSVRINSADFRKVVNNPAQHVFSALAPHIAFEMIIKDLEEFQAKLMHTVQPLPGALDFLKNCKQRENMLPLSLHEEKTQLKFF